MNYLINFLFKIYFDEVFFFFVKILKIKNLNVLILIVYSFRNGNNKIILESLKFFENEKFLLDFVKKNSFIINSNNNKEKLQIFVDLINDYFLGKPVNLYEKANDLGFEINLFQKFPTKLSINVIKYLVDNVKKGDITTYSTIGKAIGSKAYRAIGTVLKNNPFPLIIPCHRVINKNGGVGGYMGKDIGTWEQELKSHLLKIEGNTIEFN